MTYYILNKDDLHNLFRMLGLLHEEEHLIMVNNIELQDPDQENVGILVTNERVQSILQGIPEEMTEKELDALSAELDTYKAFLLKEYNQLRTKIGAINKERRKRKDGQEVTSDGIPHTIDEKIDAELRNLLS